MTKLGELLKAEREKKGLSLHEIGMNLKISPKILKAIEEGNPNDLPAKTFVRGFIKSYAQYLRLDTKMILDMFQEEYGTTRPEEPQKAQATPGGATASADQPAVASSAGPKFERSLKRPDDAALPVSNNNRIYTILIAIFLLTLIAFVAKMMDKYQKESRISNETTSSGETTTTTTTSTTLPANESEAAGMSTSISSTTTTIAGATTTSTLAATAAPTTTLKPTTTTTTSTTTTTLKAVPVTTTTLRPVATTTTSTTTTTMKPAAATTTTSSTTTTTLAKAGSTEVIVEALNKVKIRFTLNAGQKWDTIELNPDQVHTFRTKTNMELEISDGGAVNLIVNGRDRGVPGTIGRPIKLTYPK